MGRSLGQALNAAAPNFVVVTGDMVSSGVDFHADIAHVIGALRAEDGIYVSMGNHDYFGDGEPLVSLLRAQGAVVLRNQGRTVTRGDASLFVAGVDDTWTRRADLALTFSHRAPGACTCCWRTTPICFRPQPSTGRTWCCRVTRTAAKWRSPFLEWVSLGKLAHRFHFGLYREGDATLYVHPGLGTTGPPIRLGVAPEVAVFTLRPA